MISKAAYIARALARNPRASRAVAARSWNRKYQKHLIPKAFDSSETADMVYRINTVSPYTKAQDQLRKALNNAIRAKTGLKGHMPFKTAYHERNRWVDYSGLGPLGKRKTPLKGTFTKKDLLDILREGML